MAAPIQKLAQLAHKTFSALKTTPLDSLQGKLDSLMLMVNRLNGKDLNFDCSLVAENKGSAKNVAPVTYVHLWEDSVMSMGIFVLNRGTRLPLHNHPHMYGILKVIHGTINVESFTPTNHDVPQDLLLKVKPWQESMIKPTNFEAKCDLSNENDCYLLTPSTGNIHEIKSVYGPAAFLDILAPPYDHQTGARVCDYYQKLPTVPTSPNIQWIMKVPQPDDFWCDTADYTGPPLLGE